MRTKFHALTNPTFGSARSVQKRSCGPSPRAKASPREIFAQNPTPNAPIVLVPPWSRCCAERVAVVAAKSDIRQGRPKCANEPRDCALVWRVLRKERECTARESERAGA